MAAPTILPATEKLPGYLSHPALILTCSRGVCTTWTSTRRSTRSFFQKAVAAATQVRPDLRVRKVRRGLLAQRVRQEQLAKQAQQVQPDLHLPFPDRQGLQVPPDLRPPLLVLRGRREPPARPGQVLQDPQALPALQDRTRRFLDRQDQQVIPAPQVRQGLREQQARPVLRLPWQDRQVLQVQRERV